MAGILNSAYLGFSHSFWHKFLMAAIFKLDSHTAKTGFRHLVISHSLKKLSLIHSITQLDDGSHLDNSAILNYTILDSAILDFPLKLTHTCQDWFPPFAQKTLHSHFPPHHLHKKNFTHSLFHICTKKLHSLILTELDDGSHLEFCHLEFCYLGFSHLSFSSQTHSHLPRLVPTICTKTLHSNFPSHNLHKRNFTHSLVPTICTKKLHSFILTQFNDGSHLDSAILDSAILHKTLTQTNSISIKLIHSHSSWWWQPS